MKFMSFSIINTEVGVEKGYVMVEVAEIYEENDILVADDGITTRLFNLGIYDFN